MSYRYSYVFVSSVLLALILSSSAKNPSRKIKHLSHGNKNRIKSKHLEMWDIVQSIIERKATLDKIAKMHNQNHHAYDMLLENKSNIFLRHHGNRLNSSNYKEQNYKMNIEMSTLLLNEVRKLSQLEKECQDII